MNVVQISSAQTSKSGDALLTTTYDSDTVVKGKAFSFSKNFTIAIGASLFVLWNFRTYNPGPGEIGQIFILPPKFHTTVGSVIVKIYDGGDYAGGTAFQAYNPNGLASKRTSGLTLTSGATGSDKGTLFMEMLVGGASQGNQSASGSETGVEFYIRKNEGQSLVEIINESGAEIKFNYAEAFFEI